MTWMHHSDLARLVGCVYACTLLVRCGSGASNAVPAEAGVDATVSMSESGPPEGATEDTGSLAPLDAVAPGDTGADSIAVDSSNDGGPADAGSDSGVDAGVDADATVDDARADVAIDAAADAPGDAAADAPSEATVDAAVDAGCVDFNGRCIMTLATGQNDPFALVADGIDVYWTNNAYPQGIGSVMRVAVTGTGSPVPIVADADGPKFIATDATHVYWTERSTVRAWTKSTGVVSTLALGQPYPVGVAVDSQNVYWTNGNPDGGLMRVSLEGGAPTPLSTFPGNAYQLVVSPTRAYWSVYASDRIYSAPLTGGAPTLFFYDSNYYIDGIAIDGTTVYYTEESGLGPVGALPFDYHGGAPKLLATNNGTESVVSDGVYVYYTSANGDYPQYDGAVLRVPVTGGTPVTIATGGAPDSIAIDATSVYWASSSKGTISKATPR
jgi:sugar lactone lactonase YvrE